MVVKHLVNTRPKLHVLQMQKEIHLFCFCSSWLITRLIPLLFFINMLYIELLVYILFLFIITVIMYYTHSIIIHLKHHRNINGHEASHSIIDYVHFNIHLLLNS